MHCAIRQPTNPIRRSSFFSQVYGTEVKHVTINRSEEPVVMKVTVTGIEK
jgi:hypothetical protein